MSENVYIESFLQNMRSHKYSPKSINTYKYPLYKFFAFLGVQKIKIQDVTTEILEKYLLYLKDENLFISSIQLYKRAIKRLFEYLEKESIIFINPVELLEPIKVEKKLGFIPTIEEINLLISKIDVSTNFGIRDRTIIETAYSTGLRANEICKLNLDNVCFKHKIIRVVGKGNKERIVPLGQYAVKWLNKYMCETRKELLKNKIDIDALWIDNLNNKLQQHTLQTYLRKYANSANLKSFSVHCIRRACATHMLANGAHPVQIQHLLGHSTLKHLSQYLKVSITDIKKTHEKSKLGK